MAAFRAGRRRADFFAPFLADFLAALRAGFRVGFRARFRAAFRAVDFFAFLAAFRTAAFFLAGFFLTGVAARAAGLAAGREGARAGAAGVPAGAGAGGAGGGGVGSFASGIGSIQPEPDQPSSILCIAAIQASSVRGCGANPPPGVEARARLPEVTAYNLHCAIASARLVLRPRGCYFSRSHRHDGTNPTVSASTRAAFLALLALGASRDADPLPAQTVAEVQVTPETMTLGVGQKQTVFAAAFDPQGNLISNARFTFRSSDTTVARVEPDGVVVGLAPGLARVEARAQTRRGSLAVLVTGADGQAGTAAGATARPAGVTLTLEPAALRLLPGETARLVPQAFRDDGNAVEPGTVTWKSLRGDVASVDSTGVVSGVADGRTIVQAAAANGLMATAPIEVEAAEVALSKSRIVLPPDALDTLQVIVPSQGDRVPAGASWSSTDSTVARVGPTGIVQGLRPGRVEIVASGFRQERRAAVVVHPVPRAVILNPRPGTDPIQIPLGQTRRFAAVAQAEDSTPIPEVRIQWEIGDTALAAYDPAAAQLTGRALGTSSLTARVAGFQPASWAFTVVPNRLRLDHVRVGLTPGGRTTVAASLLDDDDKIVGPAAELAWTSDRPQVATVDASGTISGVRIGRAVVTAATPWGTSARLDVFVTGDLVLASNRSGGLGIWQARLAAPDTLIPILVDSATNTLPALSPDRTRIAFSSNRGERDGNMDLYVMDADGGGIRRLTTERGTDGEPAWTPDGAGIVFTSARQGSPQLYVIPADSGEARALTSAPGGNQSAAVSADGRTVAFVSLRDGGPRVYRIGIDGTGETRAGAGTLKEGAPAFLPGGELLYGVERSRNSRAWRVVRATSGAPPTPLFDTEHPLVKLSSSRGGERVLYVTARGNRPDYRVFLRGLAPPAAAVPLRPRQGEQVPSASF